MQILFSFYRIFIQILATPILLSEFFDQSTGKEYGIGFWGKVKIVFRMIQNNCRIISGSSFLEHITIAASIMKIPKNREGVVVECGSYKGVSAANLSLICHLCDRTLEIFDSFEGLPEPAKQDRSHVILSAEEVHTYEKGQWCGGLEEVKNNITRYGKIEACRFNKGYFNDTLARFTKKCALVWLDVDYRESLETCVKYLWPLLQNGGYLYTHEAGHIEIASLFFSEKWWQENLSTFPPGLVGAGSGIGLKILTGSSFNSSLGYTVKNPKTGRFKEIPQVGGMKLGLKTSLALTTSSQKTNPGI